MHARIVDQSGLVKVHINTVVGTQHKRRLHSGWRRAVLPGICRTVDLVHRTTDLRQATAGIVIFLRVVVGRNPVCLMIAGHGKFGQLVGNDKVREFLLHRKFISESQTIVENAEVNRHVALGLRLSQIDSHSVVVISDHSLFAPYGNPCFIDRVPVDGHYLESYIKIIGLSGFHIVVPVGILTFRSLNPKAQLARLYHFPALVRQRILRLAFIRQRKVNGQIAVRRRYGLSQRRQCTQRHDKGAYTLNKFLHTLLKVNQ